MREIDKKAVEAKEDRNLAEAFLKEYEGFILKAAYKATGRYITKYDDQWSVSLLAFNEAVLAYSYDKGSFLSFSEIVIKRRLYDYIKRQSRHFCEISINPHVFESDGEEEDVGIMQEVMAKVAVVENNEAKIEIEALSKVLTEYGFSFLDLALVSPKAQKTKTVCAKAIAYLMRENILLNEMRRSRMLPLKTIENNLKLPRKLLERHRKYIIAGAEIMAGDYPVLSEYLSFVREELK
ncbi:MAG: RNA polymerase subunit sigma [Sedimentibacter sp.]|uniref:RNA polymerase subunit sigma n=1 Tax=Sedimentibacter sp. TaxID=1960295 RepID=UPI0031582B5F